MSDFQAKYQKLATEYAKLKSQIPVLKKAVFDEQGKERDLMDEIKAKAQSIRKYEQEVDSLTFRNQQLSRRVELFQNDVEESNKLKQKNKHKEDNFKPDSDSNDIIHLELQSKIEENECLHKQVDEKKREYDMTVVSLRDRVDVLERDNSQHKNVMDVTIRGYKEKIDKLQEEKAMLEVRLQSQEKDVRDAKLKSERAEEQLNYVQSNLGAELTEKTKILQDKLPFNDTKSHDLNALNVPTHDRQHQLKAKELMGQASNLVSSLVKGLSDLHSYSEQRSKIYPADGVNDPISDVNKKLCQYLHDNASYLRPIEQTFRDFCNNLKDDALTTLETATGLQEFSTAFRNYVMYLNKITPYQLLSIEEECRVSTCTQTLANKNMELHGSMKKLTSIFAKLETYVSLLALQSSKSCDHPRFNQSRLFKELAASLSHLHTTLKELSTHYNSKVSLEHQLPTATTRLKTTDEFIINSLISLTACAGKFMNFMKTNLDFFDESAGYRTRGSSISMIDSPQGVKTNPVVVSLRQKAALYINSVNTRPRTESVPYSVAVQNRKTLLSSTESRDSLAQQVAGFQGKTTKLEQEREHWLLEAQLGQMKYEKEARRVKDLEERVSQLQTSAEAEVGVANSSQGSDADDVLSKKRSVATRTSSVALDISRLGTLTKAAATTGEIESAETREELIKKHFSKRIAELTQELQTADSRAVNFQAECRALQKRLALADKDKESTQEEMRTTNQSLAQLKDELNTTKKSYEDQLSMMSEHLAGMNEKLTKQKDEIDELKIKLNSKVSKKGKK